MSNLFGRWKECFKKKKQFSLTNSSEVNINDQQIVDELSVSKSWKSIGVSIFSETNCLLLLPVAPKIASFCRLFAPNIPNSQMVAVQWWQMLAHDGNNFPWTYNWSVIFFSSELSKITEKYVCLLNILSGEIIFCTQITFTKPSWKGWTNIVHTKSNVWKQSKLPKNKECHWDSQINHLRILSHVKFLLAPWTSEL